MTDAQFRYLGALVMERTAVRLLPEQRAAVDLRLSEVAWAAGFKDAGDLLDWMLRRPAGEMHARAIDAALNHETSFFRDLAPFEALRTRILPALLEGRRRERALRIWCAAVSTGQEAYSVALLLRESFPGLEGWPVSLLGTDVAASAVDRARTGIYSQIETNRGLPADLLVRWFHRRGASWEIDEGVRRAVEFRTLNLAETILPVPEQDVVLLRNVLLYFADDTRRAVVERVHRVLRPDGWLFLGAAETLPPSSPFERVDFARASCYRPRR